MKNGILGTSKATQSEIANNWDVIIHFVFGLN